MALSWKRWGLSTLEAVALLLGGCHRTERTTPPGSSPSASTSGPEALAVELPSSSVGSSVEFSPSLIAPAESMPPSLRSPANHGGPRVRVAPVLSDTLNALDLASITRQLQENIAPVERCYTSTLTRSPGLQGSLGLTLSIGPAGAVVKKLGSTLHDAALEDCALGFLRGERFSWIQERARIMVPLQFTP